VTRTLLLALLVTFAASLVAGQAAAQDPEEPMKTAAKALYNEARQARKSDDFATCYAKAKAAWAIHRHPSIAALAGDCAVGIGKYRDGAEKLQFFFDSPREIGSPELRAHLQSRLAEAKKHIAVVTVTVSVSDAACEVDGARVDPLPATLYLEPGSHAFEARHPDYQSETRQVTVKAGVKIDISFELKPTPDPVQQPVEPPSDPGMGFIVGASVSGAVAAGGLALLIASVVLHGSASDDIDRLDAEIDEAGGNGSCVGGGGALADKCSELDAAIDDQSTFATLFPVGIIIAGVGAAATATFLTLHFTGVGRTEAALRVSPTGVSLTGRF
jgi:hypothetical protein